MQELVMDNGPPFGWIPRIGELVSVWFAHRTLRAVIKSRFEEPHYSGTSFVGYVIEFLDGTTTTCGRNSMRPINDWVDV
jgi:hypothetical protein